MFAIKEREACINRVLVNTFERETTAGNTRVRIEVGTTGYKGSDNRSKGGRTFLRLECVNGDFFFVPITNKQKRIVGIEIATCGDAGLNAVRKTLRFASSTISNQCSKVND